MADQQLDFNSRFGELRSLLGQTPYTTKTTQTLWDLIFAMATQDLQQFQSKVAPYIRKTSFYKKQAPYQLEYPWEHYPRNWNDDFEIHQEIDAMDNNSYSIYLLYGWEINAADFVMCGDPRKWEGDSYVHMITPHINWSPKRKGKVIVGVDAIDTMYQDISLSKKIDMCKQSLTPRLDMIGKNLKDLPEPQFYLFGKGYKMGITLTLHAQRQHGVEPNKHLDTLQTHDEFDQDTEMDAPYISCAIMNSYIGSMGVSEVTFSEYTESNALQKLKKAGIKNPSKAYHFISHM